MSSFWQYIAQTQVGLRKGFSTQQCLLTLLEKNAVDQREFFGALVTNLSKSFDCLNHELLIMELNSCGFTLLALNIHAFFISHTFIGLFIKKWKWQWKNGSQKKT